MAKIVSESTGAFFQHYPRVAVVITAQAKGKANAMTASWHSSLSFSPPLYGVAISPERFTYQLVADSKEFGVNFLPFEASEMVASVGGSNGQVIDKFQNFNIARDKPVKTAVPILSVAYAAYECRLVDDRGYGDHRWLVGEIVAVHLEKEIFTAEEILNLDKVSPIVYLGRNLYFTVAKDTLRHLDRDLYGKRRGGLK